MDTASDLIMKRPHLSSLLQALLGLGGVAGAAFAAPTINQAPQSATVMAGAQAAFSVNATGTPPLHYTWQRNGTGLGAADQPSFTAPASILADSGASYSVMVTDGTGNTTSASAYLTVNPAAPRAFADWAAAIADPAERGPVAAPLGDGVSNILKYTFGFPPTQPAPAAGMPALAAKAGEFVFRYERDRSATGITAAVEKSTTLTAGSWAAVSAAKVGDDGAFETWEAPVATSDTRAFFRLNVTTKANAAPAITAQPAGVVVNPGQAPTFTVLATGTGPFVYQWRRNGALIVGANGASYTPPAATAADHGARFTVLVTGEAGTSASAEAVVAVNAGVPTTTYTPLARLPSFDGGPRGA